MISITAENVNQSERRMWAAFLADVLASSPPDQEGNAKAM